MADRCPFCNRADLEDPAVREAYVREIREQSTERLHGAESTWRTLGTMERLMIVKWLRGITSRPPLSDDRQMEPLWLFLHSLATDLDYQVDDPASPVVAGMVVPQPHPELHG